MAREGAEVVAGQEVEEEEVAEEVEREAVRTVQESTGADVQVVRKAEVVRVVTEAPAVVTVARTAVTAAVTVDPQHA